MNILLTGGSGFIGKSLIYPLRATKHTVLCPTHNELDLTDGKAVTDYFRNNPIDAVIHTATAGGGNRLREEKMEDMTQNLLMFKHLSLQIVGTKHPFINFGSGAEKTQNSFYAQAKRQMLMLGQYNFYYSHVRIYGCFGPFEEPQRFITSALRNYINKEPIHVHENKLMDFIYYEDLYMMVKMILNNQIPMKEFDAVYKVSHYLGNIAEYINNLNDYKVDIIYDTPIVGKPYAGEYNTFFDDNIAPYFVGLWTGIELMYENMKREKNARIL